MDDIVRELLKGSTIDMKFSEDVDPSRVQQVFEDIATACGWPLSHFTLITREGIVHRVRIEGLEKVPHQV